MPRRSTIPNSKALFLRRDAESRLKAGSAPPTSGLPLDKEALVLLYAMASDPVRSSDALRLLQELQVHQVELDLQREELENSEREMSRDLTLYKAIFELTPAPCLLATLEGQIIDANPAASSLFDVRPGELAGRTLHDFMRQESSAAWNEWLANLQAGDQAASCEVLVGTGDNQTAMLRLSANFSTDGDVLLLAVASREPVLHDLSKH